MSISLKNSALALLSKKSKFQPLSNKIGRVKNLARLTELNRWKRQMTKTCVMDELRRYLLFENTFLFWNFAEFNLLICQNEWSNKILSNFRQQLKNFANYPKGELAVCLEKMLLYVYKVFYCEIGEMKAIGSNYSNRNSSRLRMSKSHLSWGSINLGRNCQGAIIWG